jgi:aspartyl-tRNA(Asn)/glutamyl-tRNA(Gln) amidotransferase subunit A
MSIPSTATSALQSPLHALTVTQALAALRAGQFSAVELTQAYLDRMAAVEPAVQAYLTETPELALEQAARADARRAAGDEAPLLGIPLALKDVLSTRGIRTTCGSRMLDGYLPPYSATVVEKLEAAGMVLLGKSNMDEFAMGSSTENSAFHPTRNPWKLDRVPGGSSGGSAAAVAAGLAAAALGSDTGGSVRLPASFCGVVGLRPSYGRVSRYGLVAYGSSLDQVGILAQSVADAALILEVIAGHDPLDSTSLDAPVPPYSRALDGEIAGLRIGLPQEYFIDGMQPDVEQAVRAAVQRLEELGATVVPISLPNTTMALPVYYLVATAEASANLSRFDGVRFGHSAAAAGVMQNYRQSRGEGFGAEVKRRIMLGTYALSAGYYDAYYLKAQQVRTLIRQDFDAAFAQVDVIASPVAPNTAFALGARADDPLAMYLTDIFTVTTNLAGLCGISVPCGMDREGLPIGLQLLGPSLGEEQLLRTAHAYEAATDWHTLRPPEPIGPAA